MIQTGGSEKHITSGIQAVGSSGDLKLLKLLYPVCAAQQARTEEGVEGGERTRPKELTVVLIGSTLHERRINR